MNTKKLDRSLEKIIGNKKFSKVETDSFRAAYNAVTDAYANMGLIANIEAWTQSGVERKRMKLLDKSVDLAFTKYASILNLNNSKDARKNAKKIAREMWNSVKPKNYVDALRMTKEERLADLSPKLQDAFTNYANRHNPVPKTEQSRPKYSKSWAHGLAYGLGFGALITTFGIWCQPPSNQPSTQDKGPVLSETSKRTTGVKPTEPMMARLDGTKHNDIDNDMASVPTDDTSSLTGANNYDASSMSADSNLDDKLAGTAPPLVATPAADKGVYSKLSPANQKLYNAKMVKLAKEGLSVDGQNSALEGYAENLLKKQVKLSKDVKPVLSPLQKEFNKVKAYKQLLLDGKKSVSKQERFTLDKKHVTRQDVIRAYATNFGTEMWDLNKGYQRFQATAKKLDHKDHWNLDQHGFPFGNKARSQEVTERNLFGTMGNEEKSALLAYSAEKRNAAITGAHGEPTKIKVTPKAPSRFNPKAPAYSTQTPKTPKVNIGGGSGSLRHADPTSDPRVGSRLPPNRSPDVGTSDPGKKPVKVAIVTKDPQKGSAVTPEPKENTLEQKLAQLNKQTVALTREYRTIEDHTKWLSGPYFQKGQDISAWHAIKEVCSIDKSKYGLKAIQDKNARCKKRISMVEGFVQHLEGWIKNTEHKRKALVEEYKRLGRDAPKINKTSMNGVNSLKLRLKTVGPEDKGTVSDASLDQIRLERSVISDYLLARNTQNVSEFNALYGAEGQDVLAQYGGRSGVMESYRADRQEKVYNDRASGMAVKDIASKYGVSTSTVRRDMKSFQTESPIEALMADSGITEADLERTMSKYRNKTVKSLEPMTASPEPAAKPSDNKVVYFKLA